MDENKKLVDERLGEQKNISDLIEKNKLFNKQVIEYNNDILTLNEDKVDSIGELIIANYLFIHEIEYEYHQNSYRRAPGD